MGGFSPCGLSEPCWKTNFPDLFLTVLIGDVSSCQLQRAGGRWENDTSVAEIPSNATGLVAQEGVGTTEGYQGRLESWRDGWGRQLDHSCCAGPREARLELQHLISDS